MPEYERKEIGICLKQIKNLLLKSQLHILRVGFSVHKQLPSRGMMFVIL
jgi:hypothetical protein